jgi:argininosuccinate lyase
MKVLRKGFSRSLNSEVSDFVNCIDDDAELIADDITGSIAHAKMLESVGLLTQEQASRIYAGLEQIYDEWTAGCFTLSAAFEDVHMNIEMRLQELIGADALRLHTARSRNDQVALDLRLYVRRTIGDISEAIANLQAKFVNLAQTHRDVVLPGYTHLQRAQPVLLAHVALSFIAMLDRDKDRLTDTYKRTNISPLGAAALSGTGLPIQPERTAETLGFAEHFANSIDAVTDRDFVVEYLAACSLLSVHISQIAETLILWATTEFGFVTFEDEVTTASSLMPNKKNPDPLELARAKSGAICGDLMNVLIILKSLPVGYNRDLQDVKAPLIRTTKVVRSTLNIMASVLSSTRLNRGAMYSAASDPFLIATDIVEYLVLKNVALRSAHEQVSELIAYCREANKAPNELSLFELKRFAPQIDEDIYNLFDPWSSANNKKSPGGTAAIRVQEAMQKCH